MRGALKVLIAFAAAGAALAASAQDKRSLIERFAPTGETVDCIDIARIARSRILNDQNLFFEIKGGTRYINRLDTRCPGLVTERSYTYSLPTRKLCKEDVIRVFQPETGATRGTCLLGPFRIVETTDGGDADSDKTVIPHRDGGS